MSAGSTDSPDGRMPAADAPTAPGALPRGVVVLLGTAGAVVTAAGIRSFAEIVGPVFLALVLTIAVSPLRRLLLRRGVKGWLAGLIALVVVNAFLLGVAAMLAFSVAELAGLLPTYQDKFAELVADARGWLAGLGVGQEQLEAVLQKFDLGKFFDILQGWLSGLLGIFSVLAFIVAVLFFMGIDAVDFPGRLRQAAQVKPDVIAALTGFTRGTTRYLIVSTVFGVIVAAFDVAVLYLLDIPLPWLWGLLALITNYIPNVGFFIGVIPPALLALLDQGWGALLWVIVLYSVINFIIQSIIQPKVVGDTVGLSTTLTFLSLVFWAWLLGPLGAVLAIPLSLLVKALLLDAAPSTHWLAGLIAGGPLPEQAPPAARAEPPPDEVAAEQAEQAGHVG
ncbi:putative PurR-regulated permease PerM [Kribbella rubisoli]|uniref:PurR-regulated permease PerM n=1 Tax=Kribbella rubisoli TaxID=3075929 RepID=A0A4Q7WP38_9ACTN|nr:AI-2E family transporter [Kribbella rubisoli]RZU11255.1 putative PurR-regulated permease PerM [Kribbella rubisoli]